MSSPNSFVIDLDALEDVSRKRPDAVNKVALAVDRFAEYLAQAFPETEKVCFSEDEGRFTIFFHHQNIGSKYELTVKSLLCTKIITNEKKPVDALLFFAERVRVYGLGFVINCIKNEVGDFDNLEVELSKR